MKKYKVKQSKRKTVLIVLALIVVAVLFLTAGLMGAPFPAIFQFLGVCCLVADVALYDMYLSGGVELAIDSNPDRFSRYPKLYIYTTKGKHNITGKTVCVPFCRIVLVERKNSPKRVPGVSIYNMCANPCAKNVCYIEYEEGYSHAGVYCDIDNELYDLIVAMAKEYSGLNENEII